MVANGKATNVRWSDHASRHTLRLEVHEIVGQVKCKRIGHHRIPREEINGTIISPIVGQRIRALDSVWTRLVEGHDK